VKILRYSRKKREGTGYKLLVVSLIIIMFVVFLIGIQIGRVIQGNEKIGGGTVVKGIPSEEDTLRQRIKEDIEKMRGQMSEELRRELDKEDKQKLEKKKVVKTPTENTLKRREIQGRVEHPPSPAPKKALSPVIKKHLFFQVGVFSVDKNARTLKRKLERQRIPVKIELVKQKDGSLLRKVLAGPFYPSERSKYEKKLNHITRGKVIPVMR